MDAPPKVSIIIPVYNAEKYIVQTLNSIFDQSYKNIEIILIDDCSTDQSKNVIAPFLSDKVKYFCEPKNCGGPSGPRNTGIKQASGDLIMMFDSDDIMLPSKIERSVTCFIDNPDIGLLCTGFQSIDNGDSLISNDYLKNYTSFRSSFNPTGWNTAYLIKASDAYKQLFHSNFVGTSSVVIPKVVFEHVGYFDETMTNADDWDMWFRIAKHYDFIFLDEVLHQYRISPGGISARGGINALNKIKVLNKQDVTPLGSAEKQQLHYLMSLNYTALARYYLSIESRKQARAHLWQSFKFKPSIYAFKLYIKAILGLKA
ncbi:glycosyltransferase family 2 protein [Alkalimarinus sediminis]|uniref:Glycosyltransferase n=1 Tax=Alkalimarinus sediminis TaxID=1632866 RepID=A0A9E8HQE9_9ALTE|nr:glycosyltransferase [Alkalimarinus sediminis]UZW76803.1 glycosyltransferase [Alkalimarinus sediminis]